jgi:hypothetical protein
LDPIRQPALNFVVQPANGTRPNFYSPRKLVRGLQLIDHRPTQPGDLANLRQSKYLKTRCREPERMIPVAPDYLFFFVLMYVVSLFVQYLPLASEHLGALLGASG